MIEIHFDRVQGFASHPSYDDFGDFVGRGSDPYFDVIRQMVDARWPDDAAVLIDERGMRCMEVRSIRGCALRYRPTEAEKIWLEKRRKQKKAGA